ncbi:unnamed protein product [marine sediment metagenome]|uniref:Uncharacterized protein n=1 Tax=marine sediment metagenome TaxID=412755 RepID=X0SI93_9ZZZZ
MTVKPSYFNKLTSEFTDDEWKEYRKHWVDFYKTEMECDQDIAEIRFEEYCGQEGWTGRDERICMRRELAQ